MSAKTLDLPADFHGFPDLAALKTAHARLVQRSQGETATEDFLKDVEGFIIRAQATGRILEDEDDRTAAQNIIDYWVTVLLRGRRTPQETGLVEFGFHAPGSSLRDRPVEEYLAEQRMAIRRRLRLSAAAAQWQDGGRDKALLWGGRELWDAADYEDLSELEREFVAASQADERRALLVRRLAIAALAFAALAFLALIIAGLVVKKREMQHQVAKTLVERAAVLMRDGDVSGSLLWLAQALVEDREAHHDEKIHRIRIGSATAQLPKLRHALLEEDPAYLCNSAKFNADGSLVLTVSNPKGAGQGVARLWDAATGKKLADFPETGAKVNDAAFCADGRIIVASGDPGRGSGRVRLWQRDGHISTEFVASERAVLSATMSPQGDRVALFFDAAGDRPAVLEVRRISDGRSLTGPLEWLGEIRDVEFSPDGNFVAAGGAIRDSRTGRPAGQVKVWVSWTGAPCNLGMRHDLSVNCLAFAPDNLRLAVGSGEPGGRRGTVEVWSIFTGQEVYTTERPKAADQLFIQEHNGSVTSVCFSPDGRRVLSASHDETARVWDARTGAALLEFKHESSVYQAAYSPDGRTIASGGRDHTARLWKVATGTVAVPPLNHGLTVAQTVFSPDGDRLLTTTDDGARIWELRTGEPLAPLLKLSDPIWKMTISADGRLAVAVSHSGAVGTWDFQKGKEGQVLPGPEERLPALTGADGVFFSADATLALVVRGSRARVWETRGGAKVSGEYDNGEPITFAAFSPDRTHVLLASGNRGATKGVTRLWPVTLEESKGQPIDAAGVVTFATFSADGRYVLTASGTRRPASGEARVWDVKSGQPVTPPMVHNEEVTHASFSLDMARAVTASVDDTAKIWRLDLSPKTATEWRLLFEHSADLTHAFFSPDGQTVVTAGYDRAAVLWNATTGNRIAVLQHPGWINDVSFSRDGRFIVTASADHIVRVWETATGEWISLFLHDGTVIRAFLAGDDEDLHVTTLSTYEPAQTLLGARRSAPSFGSAEAERYQVIQPTRLKVQRWRLPQASQPVSELYDFAQLMRSRQIAGKRDFTRLQRYEFDRLWKDRANVVGQFNADAPPVPAGYATQESEATGEWFAAKWHLDRLIAAKPADIGLRLRRGFASANLRQWPEAVADYLQAATQKPTRSILLRLARAEIETGDFDHAIAHATQGIDALAPAAPTPADRSAERDLHMLRAEAYCATRRWDEAASDLLKSIALKPNLPSGYQRLAIVRLKQGEEAEYRKLCAQMLELFGDDDSLGGTAAWACALRQGAVPDYAIVVNLSGRTLADQPGLYYNLNTLAAALYRAGRYQEAIEKLSESRAAYVKAASQAQARSEAEALLMPLQDGRPVDWLFLAMAESKIPGRSAESEAWLKRAADAMTSRSIIDPRRTWHRLELELLLEEATARLHPAP